MTTATNWTSSAAATARLKERKSFFRRLAEKKGSPRIDHEDVIIMRKPTRAQPTE
jgi:hypothetical protein